jgi:hypothetical protein
VASRFFTDSTGTQWTVWDVRPDPRDRRSGDDRRSGRERRTDPTRLRQVDRSDRRAGVDRRVTARTRVVVQAGYEHGWLCFSGASQRRRLAPIPPDWEQCSDAALEGYCTRAGVVAPSSRSA